MRRLCSVLSIRILFIAFIGLSGCNLKKDTGMNIIKESFGETREGISVDLYTLSNTKGMNVKITNYGGIVTSILVPDRDGEFKDVVLGYDNLKGYLEKNPYFGAIIGRYGNRIGKGVFRIKDTDYTLARNNGENHLHGGVKGFDKVVWQAKEIIEDNNVGLELHYISKDGEEGYPGNLDMTVLYSLTNSNDLIISYEAITDKETVVNMTNHSYFNLAGAGSGDILEHELEIDADRFTPVDKGLIPTGELRDVQNTPMDFREATAIGARIDEKEEQLNLGPGYDHNWVLNGYDGSMRLAAKVIEPKSGRIMEVHTTEPGLQFYSGNFLDGTIHGKGGKLYEHRYGFCLETQHFPDSPNKPDFPSVFLKPGKKYSTQTIYRFLTR